MSNAVKLPASVKPLRPGDQIMVSIPHYWGKGATLADALAALKTSGGVIGVYWRIHSVHPATEIDSMGYLTHPANHAPVVLMESNPKVAA